MSIKRIKIAEYQDKRGSLDVVEFSSSLPFIPERMFWISRVPTGETRGGHAHWTCHEALFAACGSVRIAIEECGGSSECIELNSGDDGVIIPAGAWCELTDFTNDAILLVLASEPYDASGYCHDYQEWKNKKGK
ncbi:MAG: FdtA/QdtA family cupin domain-containing protein [Bacteroidaceae bacterium]|nr:FdtA/QdtA family cupin domain-containing protein [Bacteroidaceae bacterium]